MRIVFYIIWALNILCVLLKIKSKILTTISFAFSLVIVYISRSTNDYWNYYILYHGAKNGGVEVGFNCLMNIGNFFGLSYNEFLFILYLSFYTILIIVYRKYTDNFQVFFSLYFIYNYNLDTILVRNFCETVLLLVMFHFMVSKNRKAAILIMIISASIHISSLFYAPLLFIKPGIQNNKKLLKYTVLGIAGMCVVLKLFGNNLNFLSAILGGIMGGSELSDKSSYFSRSSRFGYLLYFMLCFAGIIFFLASKKILEENSSYSCEDFLCGKLKINYMLDMAYVFNYYSVFSFPLIILNMSFFRLFRNLYVINFLICCMACDSCKRTMEYYSYITLGFICNFPYKLPMVHGTKMFDKVLDNFPNELQKWKWRS